VKRIERREPQRRRQSRVLIHVGQQREAPGKQLPTIYLRTWAKRDTVPDSESACLLAWQHAAYPQLETMNFAVLTSLL
jgi:hypothetical protein